jgi:hypothetical protein
VAVRAVPRLDAHPLSERSGFRVAGEASLPMRGVRRRAHPLSERSGFRVAGEASLPARGLRERVPERAARHGGAPYYGEPSAPAFGDVAGAGRRIGEARLVPDRPPPAPIRVRELPGPRSPGIEVLTS